MEVSLLQISFTEIGVCVYHDSGGVQYFCLYPGDVLHVAAQRWANFFSDSTENGVCSVALLSVAAQRVVSAVLPCCQWQHREWCL